MTTLQVHMNTTIIKQWSVVGFVFCLGHCEEFESHRQNGHIWPVPDTLQNTWKALPHYRGIWTIFTYSSTLVVMIKFGRAVGPIACSVQPGRPADNTAAYGLLYAWKNQLQSCQNGTWTGGKLKIWCFFSPLPSFTLSLSLLPLSFLSLKRERLVKRN